MIQAEDLLVAACVAERGSEIAALVDDVVDRFRRGGRLVYAGAGTSGRLGVLDAAECPPTFGTPPKMVQAAIAGGEAAMVRSQEGAEDSTDAARADIGNRKVASRDFVLGIASSGTTPYAVAAVDEAAARGAGTGFLCCTEPPALVRDLVDHLIIVAVGPEVVSGSTRLKAGTATKMVLNTITTAAMIRSGRVYENLMVDLRVQSAKLVERGLRIITTLTDLSRAEARDVLIGAGGWVKTALAMHALRADRALAEHFLGCADGFLAEAIELFREEPRPYYGGYPEVADQDRLEQLIDTLRDAPSELERAEASARAVDAAGYCVRVNTDAWTPAQHVRHLLDFELGAIQPRVNGWFDPNAIFPDWEEPPMVAAEDLGEVLEAFRDARADTLRAIPSASQASLSAKARVGSETISLFQLLRGVAQHDEAHIRRISERVSPALLEADGERAAKRSHRT